MSRAPLEVIIAGKYVGGEGAGPVAVLTTATAVHWSTRLDRIRSHANNGAMGASTMKNWNSDPAAAVGKSRESIDTANLVTESILSTITFTSGTSTRALVHARAERPRAHASN